LASKKKKEREKKRKRKKERKEKRKERKRGKKKKNGTVFDKKRARVSDTSSRSEIKWNEKAGKIKLKKRMKMLC
jgi:hypothetical protein